MHSMTGRGGALQRREFLFALGGAATLAGCATAPRLASAPSGIVDVHAHFQPPALNEATRGAGPMGAWSLQQMMDEMEAAGVARAVLSLTTPGVLAQGEQARALTRASNEYGAQLASDHPSAFGFFIYVKDPGDADAALEEIAYGFDTLKANGVVLFTSYDGVYLGDPRFDSVFAELERRGAVVYVHPLGPACCSRVLSTVPDTVIEFGTDTTRAITNYVYSGAAMRFPNVKMIWSHAGGSMPFLIERYDFIDRTSNPNAPGGFRAAASKFFYDIAQASNPVAAGGLRKVVPTSQIVFGSDYPFRTMSEHVAALEARDVFGDAELAAVYRGNVAKDLAALL